MPKQCHNDVFDAAFEVIRSKCTRIGLVSTTIPSTISSGSADLFAVIACTTGDFVTADGDVSGRKITIAQKASVAVATTGVPGHVILFSSGATATIYYATSCSTQLLGSTANKVTIPSWKIEIADPS